VAWAVMPTVATPFSILSHSWSSVNFNMGVSLALFD
jgi:hypothetical protein